VAAAVLALAMSFALAACGGPIGDLGEPTGEDEVDSVAFSPDGRTLAAGTFMQVRLFDVRRHEQLGEPVEGQNGDTENLAFSPDGRTVASA
jgi:WD40 repeat protein